LFSTTQDVSIIFASHFLRERAKKSDHHVIRTPEHIHLDSRNFVNVVPTPFATASLGSRHHPPSAAPCIVDKACYSKSSLARTPAKFSIFSFAWPSQFSCIVNKKEKASHPPISPQPSHKWIEHKAAAVKSIVSVIAVTTAFLRRHRPAALDHGAAAPFQNTNALPTTAIDSMDTKLTHHRERGAAKETEINNQQRFVALFRTVNTYF